MSISAPKYRSGSQQDIDVVYSVGSLKSLLKSLVTKGWAELREANNGRFSRTGGAGNSWEPFLPLGLSGKGGELPDNIMEGRSDQELPSL